MLRRSFRAGLMLGLLAGIALAVLKMMQARREPAPADTGGGERWQPPPPRPPQPTPPPERSTVVTAPAHRPADVPHDPSREREDVRPTTTEPDKGVRATPVPSPEEVPHAPTPPRAAPAPAPPPAPPAPPAPPPAPPAPAPAKRAVKAAKAVKKAAKKAAGAPSAWVEPSGDVCPPSHPIKAKLVSKIFHAPGQLNYERTAPDRCYRDPAAAEGDGLRQAKR